MDLVNDNKGGKAGRQSIKTNRKSRKCCCRSNSIYITDGHDGQAIGALHLKRIRPIASPSDGQL